MGDEKRRDRPVPTGWLERGAKLAGQTSKTTFRFLGTQARKIGASPERAQELLGGFHERNAAQLVSMLGEMKGAAMKLGQLASFYEFGVDNPYMDTYRDALTMLQNSAPPMDPAASRQVIEEEFGRPLEKVFATFEDQAVAAASIGQVHRATLRSGETVAVKVQYPGVDEAVRADLKNLSALTKLSVAIAPNLDPKEVANEVRDRVLEELDYRREAKNQQKFAELFAGHPFIVVPKVYPDYCRTRVITQEFVEGDHFLTALEWDQEDKDRLAEILFRFFYGSLNRFLLFSADPHPGNYILLGKDKVAFLDFGLVRAVDPGTLDLLLEIVQSLIAEDKARCGAALEGLGILNRKTPAIDAVWDHMKMLNRPILQDEEFTISQEVMQEIASVGFDPRNPAFQTLRKIGIPGVMVTFNRMSYGVASLLGRLGATANWQAIGRELWSDEPSRTELGKMEQEWLRQAHPEHVPPLEDMDI
jgi:predicted unusual protein kinase regulating ubiquinone biosynthesis (AarF/ABC1/UbiB family)